MAKLTTKKPTGKAQAGDEEEHAALAAEAKAVVGGIVVTAAKRGERREAARMNDLEESFQERQVRSNINATTVREVSQSFQDLKDTIDQQKVELSQRKRAVKKQKFQEKLEQNKEERQRKFFKYTREHAFSHARDEDMKYGFDRSRLVSEQPTFMDLRLKDALLSPRRSHSRSEWHDPDPGCTYASKPFNHVTPLIVLQDQKYQSLIAARRKANAEVNDELSEEKILSTMTDRQIKVLKKCMTRIQVAFDQHGGEQNAEMRGFQGVDMFPEEFRSVLRVQLGVHLTKFENDLVCRLFDRDESGTISWTEVVLKFYGQAPRHMPWLPGASNLQGPFHQITPLHTQSDHAYHVRLEMMEKARKSKGNMFGAQKLLTDAEALALMSKKDVKHLMTGIKKMREAFAIRGGAEHSDLRAFRGADMLPSEFKRLMKSQFNVALSVSELKQIFLFFDRDQSKTLSFEELRSKIYGDHLIIKKDLLQESQHLRSQNSLRDEAQLRKEQSVLALAKVLRANEEEEEEEEEEEDNDESQASSRTDTDQTPKPTPSNKASTATNQMDDAIEELPAERLERAFHSILVDAMSSPVIKATYVHAEPFRGISLTKLGCSKVLDELRVHHDDVVLEALRQKLPGPQQNADREFRVSCEDLIKLCYRNRDPLQPLNPKSRKLASDIRRVATSHHHERLQPSETSNSTIVAGLSLKTDANEATFAARRLQQRRDREEYEESLLPPPVYPDRTAKFFKSAHLDPNISTVFANQHYAHAILERSRATPVEPTPPAEPNMKREKAKLKPHRRPLREVIECTLPGVPFPRDLPGDESSTAARLCKQLASDNVNLAETRVAELVGENIKAIQFTVGQTKLRRLQTFIRLNAQDQNVKVTLEKKLASLTRETALCREKIENLGAPFAAAKEALDAAIETSDHAKATREAVVNETAEFGALRVFHGILQSLVDCLKAEETKAFEHAYEAAAAEGRERRSVDRAEVAASIVPRAALPSFASLEVVRKILSFGRHVVRDFPTGKGETTTKLLRNVLEGMLHTDLLENYQDSHGGSEQDVMDETLLQEMKKYKATAGGSAEFSSKAATCSTFPYEKLIHAWVEAVYHYYVIPAPVKPKKGQERPPAPTSAKEKLKASCCHYRECLDSLHHATQTYETYLHRIDNYKQSLAHVEPRKEQVAMEIKEIEQHIHRRQEEIVRLEIDINALNVDDESLNSSRARSVGRQMKGQVFSKLAHFCCLKDQTVLMLAIGNFDAVETKDGTHHAMVAVSEIHLIATPIIKGHGGTIIMCSGLCDNIPGILVCTFANPVDAVEASMSIKRDWEAVSVREDFDLKLHDALYGRRRTVEEKYSKVIESTQHAVSRNSVPDLEICIGYGDLWHLGGHGLLGKEVSIAYALIRDRVQHAMHVEKSPEFMVKQHQIWCTIAAMKKLKQCTFHENKEFRLNTKSYYVEGRLHSEQLCRCSFKNNLVAHETEAIRHRIEISIGKGFHRTLDPVVNSGDDYEFLRLLSARRNCNTALSAEALDKKLLGRFYKQRIVVSVAMHGGPLPWNVEERKGDHSAVGMFPGTMFHAHTLIAESGKTYAEHTTPETMMEYCRNLLAFKVFVRGIKRGVRRLDLSIAPHAMLVFSDVKEAMDSVGRIRNMLHHLNSQFDEERGIPNTTCPIRGELSIAIAAGNIYDFDEEDLFGPAATKARLLSEDSQISGETVIDASALLKYESELRALYRVDLKDKTRMDRHMKSLYYVYYGKPDRARRNKQKKT